MTDPTREALLMAMAKMLLQEIGSQAYWDAQLEVHKLMVQAIRERDNPPEAQ